ncbi:MAG: glycosyltransferase family 4 protein [Rhodospirillales bacterium]|nr:glycosyltransferase family 4 protein [Rhodospirillales bacterium]|eukprot:TRINITY_DN1022_c0_g4_i1.p2 TRINITY_DN1022_c0_g4~~TRINITY_DN1022_c0_g4_i1.p2  ORF type:complete len:422 (+),score=-74.80 TRINITY_DN1022_c0_g4_i1:2117-3382(+)
MKILLISYFFAPFNSVGAVRPTKFAEYLHEAGHEVHVLTCSNQPTPIGLPNPKVPKSRIMASRDFSINSPVNWLVGAGRVASYGYNSGSAFSLKGELARYYKLLLHWPDGQVGWTYSGLKSGRIALSQGGFDLIYATASPFTCFLVASKLSRDFSIPWIAELRDLWVDNHSYHYPAWRKKIEAKWEGSVLSTASALVTVSRPLAETLKKYARPVWEIRNGYDPADVVDISGWELVPDEVINLVYTGSVYAKNNDLKTLCNGIAIYKSLGGKVRLTAAGRNLGGLEEIAAEFGISDSVEVHPAVHRSRALGLQRMADALLLFVWSGNEGIYTTKFFEYAGSGRPMLAIGSSSTDLGQWVKESSLGVVAVNAQEVAKYLLSWQEEKRIVGKISGPRLVEDFSRIEQFRKLEDNISNLLLGKVC